MYYALPLLIDEGSVQKFESEKGPDRYTFNPNDVRAKVLPLPEGALVIGQLEAGMKKGAGLEQWEMLPWSIMMAEMKKSPRSIRESNADKPIRKSIRGEKKRHKWPYLCKRCLGAKNASERGQIALMSDAEFSSAHLL